jgi:hypothetical protein
LEISSMNSAIKGAALKACRHFMLPIAKFLLRNGIGYREFAEISKLAFVQVASDEYGIRGRKTNMSRVSVMTGLNRKEIRKIRDRLANEDWELNPSLSKPVRVLAEWFTSPDYLNAKGAPKLLPFDAAGDGESFSGLVRRVGGDVPPGAMLKELARAECVKEMRAGVWKAIKRQYSPSGVDLFQVQRFGECLHDLAETIVSNMEQQDPSNRLFEFRAWSEHIDPNALIKLKKLVSAQGKVYLESIDDWLNAHSRTDEVATAGGGLRCGVGVYYFQASQRDEELGKRSSA